MLSSRLDGFRQVIRPQPSSRILAFQQSLCARVEHCILTHLGDPGLSPESIAKAHFISLRRAETSPNGSWKNASTPPTNCSPQPVTRTYQPSRDAAGFVNSAHFSRRYRLRFGTTPTAARSRQTFSPARVPRHRCARADTRHRRLHGYQQPHATCHRPHWLGRRAHIVHRAKSAPA